MEAQSLGRTISQFSFSLQDAEEMTSISFVLAIAAIEIVHLLLGEMDL
jgi:hypothetical protein